MQTAESRVQGHHILPVKWFNTITLDCKCEPLSARFSISTMTLWGSQGISGANEEIVGPYTAKC